MIYGKRHNPAFVIKVWIIFLSLLTNTAAIHGIQIACSLFIDMRLFNHIYKKETFYDPI